MARQHETFEQCQGYMGRLDAHMWHEIDGKVYNLSEHLCIADLADGDAKQPRWPIRKPFKPELSKQVIDFARKQWETTVGEMTLEEIHVILRRENVDLLTSRDRCTTRVYYLMMRWPNVFNASTLRAGSLGRRNQDGSMYWEYG